MRTRSHRMALGDERLPPSQSTGASHRRRAGVAIVLDVSWDTQNKTKPSDWFDSVSRRSSLDGLTFFHSSASISVAKMEFFFCGRFNEETPESRVNDAVVPADATFNERSRSEHPESELPPFHRISPSLTVFFCHQILLSYPTEGFLFGRLCTVRWTVRIQVFFSISVHAL